MSRPLGDRYRLEDQLGRGGMATVWRGWDVRLERPVAVKILDREWRTDPVALERLRREAHTVARLAQPNIVAMHDFDVDETGAYLVMELVDGPSVADVLLVEGPLPAREAMAIACDACEALSAAHAAGVIHRDVKPANLIVDPNGRTKVCDFGIARLQNAASQTTLTRNNVVVGTCEYMAPEQVAGDPIDARSDLYSLGCVLFAMLTGTPPFVAGSSVDVLHQHLHDAPRRVRALRADVPPELDRLVGELLAKNPADRPADAAQVRARLMAIMDGPPTAVTSTADRRQSSAPGGASEHPTQIVPQVGAGGRHRGPSLAMSLHRWGTARVAGAVAATVLVLAAAAALVDIDRSDTEVSRSPVQSTGLIPDPTTTSSAPPSAAATVWPSFTSTAPSAASPPASPVAPTKQLDAIVATVQLLVEAGQLDRNAGRGLLKNLNEVARRLARGDIGGASDELRAVGDKLDQLRQDDRLTTAGYEAFPDLDRVADSLL